MTTTQLTAILAGLVLIAVVLFVGLFEVYNPCPDGPIMNPLTGEQLPDQSGCGIIIRSRLH